MVSSIPTLPPSGHVDDEIHISPNPLVRLVVPTPAPDSVATDESSGHQQVTGTLPTAKNSAWTDFEPFPSILLEYLNSVDRLQTRILWSSYAGYSNFWYRIDTMMLNTPSLEKIYRLCPTDNYIYFQVRRGEDDVYRPISTYLGMSVLILPWLQ